MPQHSSLGVSCSQRKLARHNAETCTSHQSISNGKRSPPARKPHPNGILICYRDGHKKMADGPLSRPASAQNSRHTTRKVVARTLELTSVLEYNPCEISAAASTRQCSKRLPEYAHKTFTDLTLRLLDVGL
jgi:hypothetical protein